MSVTHSNRNVITDFIVDQIDAGASPGYIQFREADDDIVATCLLSNPAFGDADGGVAMASAITADDNAIGGTIAKAVFFDGDDNEIFRCTVTIIGGGGDIELDAVVVAPAQNVIPTAVSYEGPP